MKIAQGDTPLQGVYIPKFRKISAKFSVLGVLYLYRCTDWREIWQGGVNRAKFHPIGATCRPCGAKKLKIAI